MIYTPISTDMLKSYQNVLPTLTQWDISKQPELWSSKRIDGEMMYKIHRHSSRIVDETGLQIQSAIYSKYGEENKIFPYYYQVIKKSESISKVDMSQEFEYQTITFLNGKYQDNTILVESKENFYYEIENETYAFAILWSKQINPKTPKWFIRQYHRMFM